MKKGKTPFLRYWGCAPAELSFYYVKRENVIPGNIESPEKI